MKWTDEEVNYLKENWGKVRINDLKINKSYHAIWDKAFYLGLGPTASDKRTWTKDDIQYLQDNWGALSMETIGKNINRSIGSVQQKASDSGLGPFLLAGEYITLNQFMNELVGCYVGKQYTINQWVEKGFKIRTKKVKNNSFKVVYLEDFWKFAEKNQTIINFSKMEPFVFGKEPDWLQAKRKADIEKSFYKKTPWTVNDDSQLKTLLEQYRYTYRELSLKIRRTEGAIKRRVCDLNIKARPIKMSNHNPWSEEEINILKDLYGKGHTPNTMANYINRSAQAISGKIERLIKEGELYPRSEFRKSC